MSYNYLNRFRKTFKKKTMSFPDENVQQDGYSRNTPEIKTMY